MHTKLKVNIKLMTEWYRRHKLKWLNAVFQDQYRPSLSINYDAINKDLEKLPAQLY